MPRGRSPKLPPLLKWVPQCLPYLLEGSTMPPLPVKPPSTPFYFFPLCVCVSSDKKITFKLPTMWFMFRLLPSKLCASIVHTVFCVHTLGSSHCIIVFLGFFVFCVLCVCKLCVFVLYFMCFVLCVLCFVLCVFVFLCFVFCVLCFVLYVAGPGSSHAQAISAVGLFPRQSPPKCANATL